MYQCYDFYVYICRNDQFNTSAFIFSHSLRIRSQSFTLASRKAGHIESVLNSCSPWSFKISSEYTECYYNGDSSLMLEIPF